MSTPITTELIKELREATGVSIMQCKRALEEVEGDMEKALIVLRKKSSDIAMKKADRDANEGTIVIAQNNAKAVLIALHCETDFVAKNSDFTTLAESLATKALNESVEAMQSASLDMINPIVQKVGEKIKLGKVEEIAGTTLGSYVHGGKSAVVVSLTGGTTELAKDIAMHIAAMKPSYMTRDEINEDATVKVRELFTKEVAESGKPEDIQEKMLQGKLDTYFKEQTLVDQPFVKNPDMTVGKLLESKGAKMVKFVRESIG